MKELGKKMEVPENELHQQDVHKPNIEALLDFVNSQSDPRRFAKLLLVFCKPTPKDFTNGQKKV